MTETDPEALRRIVAIAICKSRTCEGINCCQWPANGGRTKCPVKAGGYDDAADAAIAALEERALAPTQTRDAVLEEAARYFESGQPSMRTRMAVVNELRAMKSRDDADPIREALKLAVSAYEDPSIWLEDARLALKSAPPSKSLSSAQWRPIETAPRDGTRLLVYRRIEPWSVIRVAYWSGVRGIAGWLSFGIADPPGNLGLAEPTHWQPLPAPPSEPKP